MFLHLYKKVKLCPATHTDIELTENVKEYILANRIFRPEKVINKKVISNSNEIPTNCNGYIYVIKEREFISTNALTLKVGMTLRHPECRMGEYPKRSRLIFVRPVYHTSVAHIEKIIHDTLIKLFKQNTDIGLEYYDGNEEEIINTIICTMLDNDK